MKKEINKFENILFIHTGDFKGKSGSSQRTKQMYDCISNIYSVDELIVNKNKNNVKSVFMALFFNLINMDIFDFIHIMKIVKKYKIIYLDCSLWGTLEKCIKNKFPDKILITHYHNFEKKYFEDWAKNKNFIYSFYAKNAFRNELLATKYSDVNIYISEEDRKNIISEYNVQNKKYLIIPPCLLDSYFEDINNVQEDYVIFLGSSFFANNEAARFLIDKIAQYSIHPIYIVGKGMKNTFPDDYENVKIFDYVESLNAFLNGALAFLSPIFSGSGAKIKIAEALMHGKYIIGTKESFYGYDLDNMDFCLCNSENDFINAINAINNGNRFSIKNRNLYLTKYSTEYNTKCSKLLKTIIDQGVS